MSYKKIIASLAFVSLLGALFGVFVICQPDQNGICMGQYYNSAFSVWGGSLAVFVVSVLLFFVREEAFNTWKTFAYWWIPLSIFLIFLAPSQGRGLISIDRELVTWWMSGLFLFLSLILIAWKSWRLRGNNG